MGSYPLRHQLFNWLMPVNEEGNSTNEPLAFWACRTTSRYLMRFREYFILHFYVKKPNFGLRVHPIVGTTRRVHPNGIPFQAYANCLGVHNMMHTKWQGNCHLGFQKGLVDSSRGLFTEVFFDGTYVKGVPVSVEGIGKSNLSCQKQSIKEKEFELWVGAPTIIIVSLRIDLMLVLLGLGLKTFILVCVSLSPHFWCLCNIAISALLLYVIGLQTCKWWLVFLCL